MKSPVECTLQNTFFHVCTAAAPGHTHATHEELATDSSPGMTNGRLCMFGVVRHQRMCMPLSMRAFHCCTVKVETRRQIQHRVPHTKSKYLRVAHAHCLISNLPHRPEIFRPQEAWDGTQKRQTGYIRYSSNVIAWLTSKKHCTSTVCIFPNLLQVHRVPKYRFLNDFVL